MKQSAETAGSQENGKKEQNQVVGDPMHEEVEGGTADLMTNLLKVFSGCVPPKLLLRYVRWLFVLFLPVLASFLQIFQRLLEGFWCTIYVLVALLTLGSGIAIVVHSLTKQERDDYQSCDRALTILVCLVATGLVACLVFLECKKNQCPEVDMSLSTYLALPSSRVYPTVEVEDPEGDLCVFFWEESRLGLDKHGGPYGNAENAYTVPGDSWGAEIEIAVQVDDLHCGERVEAVSTVLVVQAPPPTPTATHTPLPTRTSTPSPTPTPNGCPPPHPTPTGTEIAGQVIITNPAGDCVPVDRLQEIDVSWSEVPGGMDLWLFVYSPLVQRYYPFLCAEDLQPGGSRVCILTFMRHEPYEVIAVLAKKESFSALDETRQEGSGLLQSELPAGIEEKYSFRAYGPAPAP